LFLGKNPAFSGTKPPWAKLDTYNRPEGERVERQSQEEKLEREIKPDLNSRPKDQKAILKDEES
jgi:hypothetical protein